MSIVAPTKNYCSACGSSPKSWVNKKIIINQLAKDWGLQPILRNKFDLRESSFCPNCGNSHRTRSLAKAILEQIPLGSRNLTDWVQKANKANLKVAEINGCGQLHQILENLNKLSYSEYVPPENLKTRIKNFLKDIPNQDVTQLSHKDNQFDLVMHSDVLEHVSDYQKAIKECRRIIKPSGICLFTVPVIMSRLTKSRKNLTPSFHGSGEPDNYVFWEFGKDIIKKNKLKIVISQPEFENYIFAITK
jgi:hypothetical protein